MAHSYDALLVVSFGGPEGMDDVIPFLENVVRGRRVPRERLMQVAEHYRAFGGVSPLNAQNRALIAALQKELADHGLNLPIYFGNRNWHPLLPDTLKEMSGRGVKSALAFVTSAFSSYSGCRQYRENIQEACRALGAAAPRIDKLRVFFNHPGFIAANAQGLTETLERIPPQRRSEALVLFTAHSIPLSMARHCRYRDQLLSAAGLIAEQVGHSAWELVFQSRSGAPHQPWLESDVCDALQEHAESGVVDVVLAPIGFLSDHVEVIYDLDQEAADLCRRLGINGHRCPTVGAHPRFVQMIRQLIEERIGRGRPQALGELGLFEGQCSPDCCLNPQ